MKNAPPAFQFYPDDFLGGTAKFTDAEVGLYMRLICAQWNEGGLVNDDQDLQSYGKPSVAGPTPIERIKAKFNQDADGKLRQIRLEVEREKQRLYRESRSNNGKHGGRPQKPYGLHMVLKTKAQESSPSPSPSPSPSSDSDCTNDKASDKVSKPLTRVQKELAKLGEEMLDGQWVNDAGKWVIRIKSQASKVERVFAEVMCAIKEKRITTSPAQYAEDTWKRFQ